MFESRTPQSLTTAERNEDRALLERASCGDDRAARVLFRTHVAQLHRHAARILGSADDADVEDVVQQAFLAALDGAARFDGRSSVATWLFGITTRRALDAARARYRRGRWARLTESVGLGFLAGRPDHLQEAKTEAEQALSLLDPDQRLVFLLHDVEGRTLAEISGLTEVGISTLHSRLRAARRRIDLTIGGLADGE